MTITDAIQRWLCRWLGIFDLIDRIKAIESGLRGIGYDCHATRTVVENNVRQAQIHAAALARIVAKLDPAYDRDMLSPAVRAESDAIAKSVLQRLDAELRASNGQGSRI